MSQGPASSGTATPGQGEENENWDYVWNSIRRGDGEEHPAPQKHDDVKERKPAAKKEEKAKPSQPLLDNLDNDESWKDLIPNRPKGVTTFGEKVVKHDEAIATEVKQLDEEKLAIYDYLVDKSRGISPEEKIIPVAHFNFYCPSSLYTDKYLLPAEFAMYSMTVGNGLSQKDGLYGLIDPEQIPRGLRAEATENAEALKVPRILGFEGARAEGAIVFDPYEANIAITKWMDECAPEIRGKKCLFVTREQMPIIDRCLKWLKHKSTEGCNDNHGYSIISLTTLIFALQELDIFKDTPLPLLTNEGAAEKLLEHTKYSYCVELACNWHNIGENQDSVEKCSNNIVQRLIYNMSGFFQLAQNKKLYSPNFIPVLEEVDVVDRVAMAQLMKDLEQADRYNKMFKPRRDGHKKGN